MSDDASGGWHQSTSATSGLTNYDLRVSPTARRYGRRARRGGKTLLLATDFKKVNGMNTQLDLMLQALAKSVSSILEAPVKNRRELLQKTCSQFRKAATSYIEDGLEKAYRAGEGSSLSKSIGKRRLRKDHSEIQVMASVLAQVEDLMGRLARNSYDNPALLTALQSWMADGAVLLSDMASSGVPSNPAPVYDEYEDGGVPMTPDQIEGEVEKFARNLVHKLRKAEGVDEDFDDEDFEQIDLEDMRLDDDEDDEDEEGDEEDQVEKFARVIAKEMRKAVGTKAKKIPGAKSKSDNDLGFDLDDFPGDYPIEGDMTDITDTDASQVLDDDEVTGNRKGSPNLEAEVRKFARRLARQMQKSVDVEAEEIPDAEDESDNDLDFDLDEDPDGDDPVEGDMTGIADPHASQVPEGSEVSGEGRYSPELEEEVAKYARKIARRLSKQSPPPQSMAPEAAPGNEMQDQELDLDSPEVIGRLSAAIFEEAAKMKQGGEEAPPEAAPAPMENQGFQKMAGSNPDRFQQALQKAASNVLQQMRKNTPAPAKGVVKRVVSKSDDTTDLAKMYGGVNIEAEAERLEKLSPEARAAELIKFAHQNPRSLV